jgi:hypothetical protein
MGVYLMGAYLMGAYLMGMRLIGMHLKGVQSHEPVHNDTLDAVFGAKSSAKSVADPWGAMLSKGGCDIRTRSPKPPLPELCPRPISRPIVSPDTSRPE